MATSAKRANASPWFMLILVFFINLYASCGIAAKPLPRPAPEITHTEGDTWINSTPLSLIDLRGKVILINFWTFDCWNCHRSFIWLNTLEDRFKNREFMVIGVHTPEFEHERHRSRLEDKVKLYNLRHPIMIDNDFSYWNAVGCRYWPSFFAIDKQGSIRAVYIGQTDLNSGQAKKIEQMIETLLVE